jgi:dolichyl-phosphate-mannose--protein O-mannosyl transferase
MSLSKKLLNQRFPWFWMGIAAVFLLSVSLRFWGLSRFNTLVFDEVYYAKFANNYLTRTPFFDGHPPLSKYIIAIAIWIGSHLPFGQDAVNSLTGSLRSTWSYRWLNALTGSFIPLVVAGIAYQLSHRRSYALIAALFAAADGLFLVESRYALNNVYLVIFGLLGQWFLLLALERGGRQRSFWLILTGIGFGASAAIKWNGLWFLLGAYLIWSAAWIIRWVHQYSSPNQRQPVRMHCLQNLTQLNIWHVLFYLAIIPAVAYSIEWIPHLQLNPIPGFWEVHKQILEYHQRIGDGPKVHRYCSNWYTWLLMIRPVAYFYQTAQSATEPLPVMGPPLPAATGKVIYDVHAIGNPALWWLSTAAILLLLGILAQRLVAWLIGNRQRSLAADTWIILYLVINWLANLLPWVRVTRCTFMYHYMGASVFSGLAIALLVDKCLHSYRHEYRVLGVTIIFLILLAFVFWMPIYLGLPLSPESYRLRMWFSSWI